VARAVDCFFSSSKVFNFVSRLLSISFFFSSKVASPFSSWFFNVSEASALNFSSASKEREEKAFFMSSLDV
jgi:hypothetical protein